MQVFDWELSEEDQDKINQIPQHRIDVRTCLREEYDSANGPYKHPYDVAVNVVDLRILSSTYIYDFPGNGISRQ